MQSGNGAEAVDTFRKLIAAHPSFACRTPQSRDHADAPGGPRRRRRASRAVTANSRTMPRRSTTSGWRSSSGMTSIAPKSRCAARWRSIRGCGMPPFTLGVVLWQTGRGRRGRAVFREAIARNPDSADAHYMLGDGAEGQRARPDGALPSSGPRFACGPTRSRPIRAWRQLLQQRATPTARALARRGGRPAGAAQGRRTGLGVRGERGPSEAEDAAIGRRDRPVPRSDPPCARQCRGAPRARARAAAGGRRVPRRGALRTGAEARASPLSARGHVRDPVALRPCAAPC